MQNTFFIMSLMLISSISSSASNISHSLDKMTLEEKVGQLLMVQFHGEEVNEDARTLIQDLHVGGIIYYNWSNGLHSPQHVQTLSMGLQQLATSNSHPIPLLIATDQEGGIVARLTNGFTIFPGNKALGVTGDPLLAEKSALIMGEEMGAVGVNMNLAPVVDINNNPKNPLIGIRSYGETPHIVTSYAERALRGYHTAGIITSLKHFPGHGDVEVDSHEALPVLHKTKEELWKMELLPFVQLADAADTIMTAHIMVPHLDPKNCATLSPKILGLLRTEIGFEGVIITDSLVMDGLLKNCSSVADAAVRALNAGCDILLLGGKQLTGPRAGHELSIADIEKIHAALVDGVKKGIVSNKRLSEAVSRILVLKDRYLSRELLSRPIFNLQQQFAAEIAHLATKVVQQKPVPPSFAKGQFAIFAPQLVLQNIQQTSFQTESASLFSFKELNPSLEEIEAAKGIARESDLIVCFSYNAWKNEKQRDLFQELLSLNKPVIIIAIRDPTDESLFPNADLVVTTFSPTIPSIEAAYQQIASRIRREKGK